MKKIIVLICFALFKMQCFAQNQPIVLSGTIKNYNKQLLSLYKCGNDTLLLMDSARTDSKGKFTFYPFSNREGLKYNEGMYKIVLPHNQSFFILYDIHPINIETVYAPNIFRNIATDSLVVLKSEENKCFYQFQQLQQKNNVANYYMLQMMRLYPLQDPFHKNIEAEYFNRYKAMDNFVKESIAVSKQKLRPSLASIIAKAYYQPVNPDWKQPDTWRDSIIAVHYFDYFNPTDSGYLNTNILSEKMQTFLDLRANLRDTYGQPIKNETILANAAITFINKTQQSKTYSFCLNYFLKQFNKEHKEDAFLILCDTYLKTQEKENCGSLQNDEFMWARKKADALKNVQIGNVAPDFQIIEKKLNLYGLESDYTLVVFWASWCPHCVDEIPNLKKITANHSPQQLMTVAISLDTDKETWQKFLVNNNLNTWLNYSELKSWKSDVVKKYNVYATPTMFLLDKNKKIIAKPETAEQLIKSLKNAK